MADSAAIATSPVLHVPDIQRRELPSSPADRRLRAEHDLLIAMTRRNPSRLQAVRFADRSISLELLATPAPSLESFRHGFQPGFAIQLEHRVRVEYSRYFPAAPLELYLDEPVAHPNIHPETGFVCLWAEHRVDYTIVDALSRTAAMLGWRLMNLDAVHRMQPDAWNVARADCAAVARRLLAAPLARLSTGPEPVSRQARKRLS